MKHKHKQEFEVEFVAGRDMTEAEMESLAQMLFQWWKRDYGAGRTKEESVQVSGQGAQH